MSWKLDFSCGIDWIVAFGVDCMLWMIDRILHVVDVMLLMLFCQRCLGLYCFGIHTYIVYVNVMWYHAISIIQEKDDWYSLYIVQCMVGYDSNMMWLYCMWDGVCSDDIVLLLFWFMCMYVCIGYGFFCFYSLIFLVLTATAGHQHEDNPILNM